jgi:hypothetical protein
LTAFVETGTKWTVGHLTALALTPGIASTMTRTVFGAGATKKFQFIQLLFCDRATFHPGIAGAFGSTFEFEKLAVA